MSLPFYRHNISVLLFFIGIFEDLFLFLKKLILKEDCHYFSLTFLITEPYQKPSFCGMTHDAIFRRRIHVSYMRDTYREDRIYSWFCQRFRLHLGFFQLSLLGNFLASFCTSFWLINQIA